MTYGQSWICFDQPGPSWILPNVFGLFVFALVVLQAMIEEIPLSTDLRCFCRDSLEVANQVRQSGIAVDRNQHVQVIRH